MAIREPTYIIYVRVMSITWKINQEKRQGETGTVEWASQEAAMFKQRPQ